MRKTLWVDLVSGLLILLFFYTALSKLFHYRQFRGTLSTSPLIGYFSGTIAWALPVAEILVSLLLFFPSTKRSGLYASLVMLTLFTIYLGYLLLFSKHLPCSCGGVIGKMSWKQHVPFNLFFIGMAITGLHLSLKPKKGWDGPVPYPTKSDVL